MDYGRRPYASPSSDYKTFMAEITDQYVKSIGGVRPAGMKRPYVHQDYNSMQYLFNTERAYLGGATPALSDLYWAGIQPVEALPIITPKHYIENVFKMEWYGDGLTDSWIEKYQNLTYTDRLAWYAYSTASYGNSGGYFEYLIPNLDINNFIYLFEINSGSSIPSGDVIVTNFYDDTDTDIINFTAGVYGGQIRAYLTILGVTSYAVVAFNSVYQGGWNSFILEYKNNTARLYLGGALILSFPRTDNLPICELYKLRWYNPNALERFIQNVSIRNL